MKKVTVRGSVLDIPSQVRSGDGVKKIGEKLAQKLIFLEDDESVEFFYVNSSALWAAGDDITNSVVVTTKRLLSITDEVPALDVPRSDIVEVVQIVQSGLALLKWTSVLVTLKTRKVMRLELAHAAVATFLVALLDPTPVLSEPTTKSRSPALARRSSITAIPLCINHGALLAAKGITTDLSNLGRISFKSGERLVYHYHNSYTQGLLDCCILVTTLRIFNYEGGEEKDEVWFSELTEVHIERNSALSCDRLFLVTGTTHILSIINHEAATFFYRHMLTQIPPTAVGVLRVGEPTVHCGEAPSTVNWGSDLRTSGLLDRLQQKRIKFLLGEQLLYHCVNTNLTHKETAYCILVTSQRVVQFENKEEVAVVLFRDVSHVALHKGTVVRKTCLIFTMRDNPITVQVFDPRNGNFIYNVVQDLVKEERVRQGLQPTSSEELVVPGTVLFGSALQESVQALLDNNRLILQLGETVQYLYDNSYTASITGDVTATCIVLTDLRVVVITGGSVTKEIWYTAQVAGITHTKNSSLHWDSLDFTILEGPKQDEPTKHTIQVVNSDAAEFMIGFLVKTIPSIRKLSPSSTSTRTTTSSSTSNSTSITSVAPSSPASAKITSSPAASPKIASSPTSLKA